MLGGKDFQYEEMVRDRKRCEVCKHLGLTNPSQVVDADGACGAFDSKHIGAWTRWNGNLDADVMVIGQEWGDVVSFQKQWGLDISSPTNRTIQELLAVAGVKVADVLKLGATSRVFMTNAALCLKQGGMQAAVNREWFTNCAKHFLRRQIELVKPKVAVTLGERAYVGLRDEFGLKPRMSFRRAVLSGATIDLMPGIALVPMYHCGARILNGHRRIEQQREDWKRVSAVLKRERGHSLG